MDAMRARVDLLCLTLQEMARVLPAVQAGEVATAIRHRIDLLADGGLSPEVDRAVAADLMPLLRALGVGSEAAPHPMHRLRLVTAALPESDG